MRACRVLLQVFVHLSACPACLYTSPRERKSCSPLLRHHSRATHCAPGPDWMRTAERRGREEFCSSFFEIRYKVLLFVSYVVWMAACWDFNYLHFKILQPWLLERHSSSLMKGGAPIPIRFLFVINEKKRNLEWSLIETGNTSIHFCFGVLWKF